MREERAIIEGLDFDREALVFAGGFMPGDSAVTGAIPKDKDEILRALAERRVINAMLDEKVCVNGSL